MVYSVRSDRPIISSAPLKAKRTQGEHSKRVEEFMKEHRISVKASPRGEAAIVTETSKK